MRGAAGVRERPGTGRVVLVARWQQGVGACAWGRRLLGGACPCVAHWGGRTGGGCRSAAGCRRGVCAADGRGWAQSGLSFIFGFSLCIHVWSRTPIARANRRSARGSLELMSVFRLSDVPPHIIGPARIAESRDELCVPRHLRHARPPLACLARTAARELPSPPHLSPVGQVPVVLHVVEGCADRGAQGGAPSASRGTARAGAEVGVHPGRARRARAPEATFLRLAAS